jgi:biopolymer transport protein ExbD
MRPRLRQSRVPGELLITPMVDVVFLLLVFFLMTLRIVAPEGDFDVKMPRAAALKPTTHHALAIPIRLRATADGRLADVRFGNRSLGNDLESLRNQMRRLADDEPTVLEGARVRLDCDYHLRYEYLVEAMTAVSGYVDQRRVVPLVDGIELAPARTR